MTVPSTLSDAAPSTATPSRSMRFSLYYFTGRATRFATDRAYDFLLETVRFGERHGFHAVWTPERHFHEFGGLFPNPSVLSAAIAGTTERIRIRAGSVVLPLHHPIRLVEEWSLVDNLSSGRVGISVATGWHIRDFVIRPEAYDVRLALAREGISLVRRLWAGEAVPFTGVDGREQLVRTLPRPVQAELPIWITSTGTVDSIRAAGALGANVFTSIMGCSVTELGELLSVYFETRREHGHDRESAEVTVMLHTFLGTSDSAVREIVEAPLCAYLRRSLQQHEDAGTDGNSISEAELDHQVRFAFERYFRTAALLGTPEKCAALVEQLAAIGVTEVACLIDFGVGLDDALTSLRLLDELRAAHEEHGE